MNTITINGVSYPILCDLNALETIQEEFESINKFEMDLLGLKLVKDEGGKQVYERDGSPKMELIEPKIKAIKIALVAMINEGLRFNAYQSGTACEQVSGEKLIAECEIPYYELARKLHEEYKRCFASKKN